MDRCDGCGNRIDTSVEEYTRLPNELICQHCMDRASSHLCEVGLEAESSADERDGCERSEPQIITTENAQ